ncbi:hypothetical protein M409DRAFT_23173 [Zasmidium cellare ATCC 36951]|uniref:Rad60/SUMO-like domain-containing protein n=1 Tax=Zasmidium cellare ATCC 36951 TaxID=1080233 RepID=A0A6A6CH97_ZASCE|nr:uncharacterized protein M409DRAFT_23173 [Zasmidium cellare ATCC 36951]KAF2166535.1 hypothetical protein M409DRAFT_23173 [Zasmidium cellare ATCC 36951]
MDNTGISVNLPLPVCGTSGKDIEIKFDTQYTGVEDAAEFVNTLLHRSHARYHEAKDTEQQRPKRHRTDESFDLERRRAGANEAIVFRINGAQSTSQFRIKRSDQFKRSLELFAEQNNKQYENLKLFYDGRWVPAQSSPADVSESLILCKGED